jgi:hypothetical protein
MKTGLRIRTTRKYNLRSATAQTAYPPEIAIHCRFIGLRRFAT